MRDAVALLHRSTEASKKIPSTGGSVTEPFRQARSLVRRLLADAVVGPDILLDGPVVRKPA